MKSVSVSFAPAAMTLLLLFVASWLALEASDATDAVSAAQTSTAQALQAEQLARSSLEVIRREVGTLGGNAGDQLDPSMVGTDVDNARTLDAVLAQSLAAIHTQARARQIAIDKIATASTQQQGFAGADTIAQPVPLTSGRVRAIRLMVQGGYGDYGDFKRFLADMALLTAIQSLKVTGEKFEATVEIYGEASDV